MLWSAFVSHLSQHLIKSGNELYRPREGDPPPSGREDAVRVNPTHLWRDRSFAVYLNK